MVLSHAVSEINGDICKNFLTPLFNAPAEGFPLECCNDGGLENTIMMPLPGRQKV